MVLHFSAGSHIDINEVECALNAYERVYHSLHDGPIPLPGLIVSREGSETICRINTRYGTFEGRSMHNLACVADALNTWEAYQKSLPRTHFPADVKSFNGVGFLDIQDVLMKYGADLTRAMRRLADGLLFDTVVVLDARGFLLAGEFMRDGYPIVMARKPGKLPGDVVTVKYDKEYGSDELCIQRGRITPGNRVVVIDDLAATGGTLQAAESLVTQEGGQVVAFLVPYVVKTEDGLMCKHLVPKLRFLNTAQEAVEKYPTTIMDHPPRLRRSGGALFIATPSLYSLCGGKSMLHVEWGRYHGSSNIWFDAIAMENKEIFVLLNPSNERETLDMLQLLSVIYRKKPRSVTVVIPFLDQSTQDRIEYSEDIESLALVDTMAKLLGTHSSITFDLHAEQSVFAFHDMRIRSLVEVLYKKYQRKYPYATVVFPDAGAAKRFGPRLEFDVEDAIVYRKIRRGEERIVTTDDELEGQRFVIVDDLVRSGGTIRAVAQHIKSVVEDAKVDCLFAHAPLERAAAKNLGVIDEVWTSDSCGGQAPREWVKVHVLDHLF